MAALLARTGSHKVQKLTLNLTKTEFLLTRLLHQTSKIINPSSLAFCTNYLAYFAKNLNFIFHSTLSFIQTDLQFQCLSLWYSQSLPYPTYLLLFYCIIATSQLNPLDARRRFTDFAQTSLRCQESVDRRHGIWTPRLVVCWPTWFSNAYWHRNARVIEIQKRQQLKNNFFHETQWIFMNKICIWTPSGQRTR